MTARVSWLDVDLQGWGQILRNKGIARVLLEPIANALDTQARKIGVSFEQENGRAYLGVSDDDPDGFADLREAFTLFAPSRRRDDPTKRGRFGQGEKEVIAICAAGGRLDLVSTTGTIVFEKEGRRFDKTRTTEGTSLVAEFRCNQREAKEFERLVRTLIVPPDVTLTFNDDVIGSRQPVQSVQATLPTVITDEHGNLTRSTRQTTVDLYEPWPGETATIYELGVPVVDHDGRWHVDVNQKVPLNTARDNVTPAYLRRLRELMLNASFEDLTSVDMKQAWVVDALPAATPEALADHVHKVHGPDAVIFDPSNLEAVKRAGEQGRVVVHGRQFSVDTWKRIREAEILKPAGQVIPTGIETSPDGQPPIPVEHWTPAMHAIADYTRALGKHALGFAPTVDFQNINVSGAEGHTTAWWGGRSITFNLRWLGKTWPDTVEQEDLDDLIIHEFAHHGTGHDHYSSRFYNACTRIGASLRRCPARLDQFRVVDDD